MQRSFRIYEKRTNHSRDGEFKRVHTKRVYMYLSVFNREGGRERGAEDWKWATTPAATTALAKTCSIRLTLLHTRSHTIHNFLLSSMSLCVPSIHPSIPLIRNSNRVCELIERARSHSHTRARSLFHWNSCCRYFGLFFFVQGPHRISISFVLVLALVCVRLCMCLCVLVCMHACSPMLTIVAFHSDIPSQSSVGCLVL